MQIRNVLLERRLRRRAADGLRYGDHDPPLGFLDRDVRRAKGEGVQPRFAPAAERLAALVAHVLDAVVVGGRAPDLQPWAGFEQDVVSPYETLQPSLGARERDLEHLAGDADQIARILQRQRPGGRGTRGGPGGHR